MTSTLKKSTFLDQLWKFDEEKKLKCHEGDGNWEFSSTVWKEDERNTRFIMNADESKTLYVEENTESSEVKYKNKNIDLAKLPLQTWMPIKTTDPNTAEYMFLKNQATGFYLTAAEGAGTALAQKPATVEKLNYGTYYVSLITPPITEISCVKNGRAIVLCGFLTK